ncbi:putative BPL/LPL catalytic domain-containing protein [Seiridium unicorne]|uniref:BPL/LPL catalytic domain-containing protein n=1 Tax=Seiridium unicorne TaxID=138068 RepID=A0ABR2UH74_9PEZI
MAPCPLTTFILPYKPDFCNLSRVTSWQQTLRHAIINQRTKNPSSTAPVPPVFLAYEPAPSYLHGTRTKLRPSSPWQGLLQTWGSTPDLVPEVASAHWSSFPKLNITSWRSESDAGEHGKPAKPQLAGFECEASHQPHPLHKPMTTYLGPGHVVIWAAIDVRHGRLSQATEAQVEKMMSLAAMSVLQLKFPGVPKPKLLQGEGLWVSSPASPRGNSRKTRETWKRIADVFIHVDDEDIASLGLAVNIEGPTSSFTAEGASPWWPLRQMDVSYAHTTSVCAELGDAGHALGRRFNGIDMVSSMSWLTAAVAYQLGYGRPEWKKADEILGEDAGGGSGAGWTFIPVPDFFIF